MVIECLVDYPSPQFLGSSEAYPGRRPSGSYVLVDQKVIILEDHQTLQAMIIATDQVLVAEGVVTIEDRFPILSFGSNACPGQLHNKLVQEGVDPIIPCIKGKLKGFAPAYAAKLGIYGYCFANLYPEEGAEMEIFVSFFDSKQLEVISASERNYRLAYIGEVELVNDDIVLPVFGYAGNTDYLASPGREPLVLAAISHKSNYPVISQSEAVATIVEAIQLDLQEYLGELSSLSPSKVISRMCRLRQQDVSKAREFSNFIEGALRKRNAVLVNMSIGETQAAVTVPRFSKAIVSKRGRL